MSNLKDTGLQAEIEITKLVFPENVRKRPGMYLGNPDQPGVAAREVVDNFIDEILGGHANCGLVWINRPDGSCTVVDNGRGVPVNEIIEYEVKPEIGQEKLRQLHDDWYAAGENGLDPLKDLSNYNLIKTGNAMALDVWGSLHSSSKFGDDKVSVGLNGVGASCTNATSEIFVGYINLRKKSLDTLPAEMAEIAKSMEHPVYKIEFRAGYLVSQTIIEYETVPDFVKEIGESFGTGVYFIPDAKIWASTEIKYDLTNLSIARKVMADDIVIKFNGEEIEPYDLKKDFDKTEFIEDQTFSMECDASIDGVTAQVKFQFGYSSNDFDYKQNASINTLHTPDGFHIDNIRRGIGEAVSEMANGISSWDCRLGLRVFGLVFTNKAVYNSQTKEKCVNIKGLSKTAIEEIVAKTIRKAQKKDEVLNRILQLQADRIVEYKKMQGNLSLQATVDSAIKKSGSQRNARGQGTKLYACHCKDRTQAELFIVEGDSAAGSLVTSPQRETKFHAILPLRGKPLNGQTKELEDTLDNKEMKTLLNTAGTGITGFGIDITQSMYGKYIIMADEDADGKNILALLVGNFGKYLREVVEAGMVYICEVPLYIQGEKFIMAGEEFDRKKSYSRFKGLGSMNPDQIGEFAFSSKRRLIRVTADFLDEALTIVRTTSAKRDLMVDAGIVEA